MKLREFIDTQREYEAVEKEIREWVEQSYDGLSIEFYPHLELVQIDPKQRFTKCRIRRIVEAVNIKIGDIMEKNAREWRA